MRCSVSAPTLRMRWSLETFLVVILAAVEDMELLPIDPCKIDRYKLLKRSSTRG
jgi:hypothetical protein